MTTFRDDCEKAMKKRDESIAAAKEDHVAVSTLTFACFFKLCPVLKIRSTNL